MDNGTHTQQNKKTPPCQVTTLMTLTRTGRGIPCMAEIGGNTAPIIIRKLSAFIQFLKDSDES